MPAHGRASDLGYLTPAYPRPLVRLSGASPPRPSRPGSPTPPLSSRLSGARLPTPSRPRLTRASSIAPAYRPRSTGAGRRTRPVGPGASSRAYQPQLIDRVPPVAAHRVPSTSRRLIRPTAGTRLPTAGESSVSLQPRWPGRIPQPQLRLPRAAALPVSLTTAHRRTPSASPGAEPSPRRRVPQVLLFSRAVADGRITPGTDGRNRGAADTRNRNPRGTDESADRGGA